MWYFIGTLKVNIKEVLNCSKLSTLRVESIEEWREKYKYTYIFLKFDNAITLPYGSTNELWTSVRLCNHNSHIDDPIAIAVSAGNFENFKRSYMYKKCRQEHACRYVHFGMFKKDSLSQLRSYIVLRKDLPVHSNSDKATTQAASNPPSALACAH